VSHQFCFRDQILLTFLTLENRVFFCLCTDTAVYRKRQSVLIIERISKSFTLLLKIKSRVIGTALKWNEKTGHGTR